MVHDRRVGGQELTLGVSGKLIDGNLVMYDVETESLWLQATGEQMTSEGGEGASGGKKLEELPREEWGVERWADWSRQHPDTLVLTCAHCEGRGEATGTIDELYRTESAETGGGDLAD